MFCTNCGDKVKEIAEFCSACGTKIKFAKGEEVRVQSLDSGHFVWKITQICLSLIAVIFGIWLIITLGPLWIIALILLGILIALIR